MDPANLLTYDLVSKRLGVDVRTLRVWLNRGRLPKPDLYIGNRPIWYPQTIDRWQQSGWLPQHQK